MNARIVFLAGVHGVGKGSLADYLSKKYVVPNYSSSTLIKLEKNKPVASFKRVLGPTENQDYLVKALNKLDTNSKRIILDGHFVLLTAEGFFEVPFSLFECLPIDSIILKTLDENIIYNRLLLRDGNAPEIDALRELQTREIERAKEVASLLKVNLIVVDSDNYEDVDFLNTE